MHQATLYKLRLAMELIQNNGLLLAQQLQVSQNLHRLNGATNSGTGADVTFSDTNGRLTATFNTAGAGMNANSIDMAFTDAITLK